jgi:hypothetical protein
VGVQRERERGERERKGDRERRRETERETARVRACGGERETNLRHVLCSCFIRLADNGVVALQLCAHTFVARLHKARIGTRAQKCSQKCIFHLQAIEYSEIRCQLRIPEYICKNFSDCMYIFVIQKSHLLVRNAHSRTAPAQTVWKDGEAGFQVRPFQTLCTILAKPV